MSDDAKLAGRIRTYSRGFYTVDLVPPFPDKYAALDPMFLRASQFDPGVSKNDGAEVVLKYRASMGSGLWCAVRETDEATRAARQLPAVTPEVKARALELATEFGQSRVWSEADYVAVRTIISAVEAL